MKKVNVTEENLQTIIEECNFVPSSRKILVTLNEIQTENDLELVSESELTIDDWQYVIAGGKNAAYQAGDRVYLDLAKLVKRVPNPVDRTSYIEKIDIQPFPWNGNMYTLLDDSVIAGSIDNSEQPDIKV